MKRFLLSLSTFVFVAAIAQACGGSDDDLATDAAGDQTSGDVATKDSAADVAKDAPADVAIDSPGDASEDVTADVASDAPDDVVSIDAPVDAPIDVITLDGGGCTTNAQCKGNEYCAKANGDCGGVGQCMVKPQFCPLIVSPVCGCDTQSYTNYCYANRQGVNVAYTGSCE